MKYEVIVSGVVLITVDTKAEAEARLQEARNSFLALVHPQECFYIRKVSAKNI